MGRLRNTTAFRTVKTETAPPIPSASDNAVTPVNNGLRTSTLVYLYYDRPGREAAAHAAELERVVARVAHEIDLRVATYQSLFAALRAAAELPRDYVDYLAQRYFA